MYGPSTTCALDEPLDGSGGITESNQIVNDPGLEVQHPLALDGRDQVSEECAGASEIALGRVQPGPRSLPCRPGGGAGS